MMKFSNLIDGKESLLSGKRFIVKSQFYDFATEAPDSNLFDLKIAVSKARSAISECNSLSFEEKKKILARASRKKFTKENIEYIVKMTGMPISDAEQHLAEIPDIMRLIPEYIEKWIGVQNGKISRRIMEGEDLVKILHPIEGILYGVTPGNDSRAVAFVASWLTILGIPGIIKVSKEDVFTSIEIVKSIIEAGYPASGLAIVCWNSSSKDAQALNFYAVDSAQAVWVFGENNTVDKVLRFEEQSGHTTDHFAGKIVLRHATGRSAALVSSADTEKAAPIITESAFFWPIGCKALKSIFTTKENHDAVKEEIFKHASAYTKNTGDPLKRSTKVGYVNKKLLDHVMKRIHDLKRLNQLQLLEGHQLSEIQSTPLILETKDVHSEFLSKEYSVYVLCLKQCKNYDDAVKEMNMSAGDSHRISVSVFSEEQDKVLRTIFKAHHIKHFKHSSELDYLFHEGNDYLHKLTVPQIHRIRRK